MTTYKAILEILKRKKGSLLLGIIIMAVITFFYAGQLTKDAEELTGAKIAILSEDDSAIEKGFVDYLAKQRQSYYAEGYFAKSIRRCALF